MSSTKKELSYLSHSEIELLRSAAPKGRTATMVGLLYETGCQPQELVAIKWSDVHLGRRTVTIGSRVAKISTRLVGQLSEVRGRESEVSVFATRQSTQMTTKRVRQIIAKLSVDVLGCKVTPMVIRYSHIAHALQNGVEMRRIRKHIGLRPMRAQQLKRLFAQVGDVV